MKVLSLCGGIECGAVAIKRLGIKPEQYFSSEIDKDAIAVATDNHPHTFAYVIYKIYQNKTFII